MGLRPHRVTPGQAVDPRSPGSPEEDDFVAGTQLVSPARTTTCANKLPMPSNPKLLRKAIIHQRYTQIIGEWNPMGFDILT